MLFYTAIFLFLSTLLVIGAGILLVLAIRKKKWKYALWGLAVPVLGWTVMFLVAAVFVHLMDFRLKRPVLEEEVVGVWQLRDASIEVAKGEASDPYVPEPGHIHNILFRKDGTCRFRSLTQRPTAYLDCEGTWKMSHDVEDEDVPEVRIVLNRKTWFHAFSYGFTEEDKHLVLYQYWGDPDNGKILKYDKTPPNE